MGKRGPVLRPCTPTRPRAAAHTAAREGEQGGASGPRERAAQGQHVGHVHLRSRLTGAVMVPGSARGLRTPGRGAPRELSFPATPPAWSWDQETASAPHSPRHNGVGHACRQPDPSPQGQGASRAAGPEARGHFPPTPTPGPLLARLLACSSESTLQPAPSRAAAFNLAGALVSLSSRRTARCTLAWTTGTPASLT